MQFRSALKYIAPLIFVCTSLFAPSAYAQGLPQVRQAWEHGDFGEVIRLYQQLSQEDQSKAQPLFWVGSSYMRRHDFKSAQPFIQKALSAGLPQRPEQTASDIIKRIDLLNSLCPPFLQSFQSGGKVINVYASKTPWAKDLMLQMPQYLARGNEAYPGDSATINFYLFDQRGPYDQFFTAWQSGAGGEPPTKHRGTGGFGLVEFCQFYPTGQKVGTGNINDLYSRLLHEYSHALCATIYGDGFGRACPIWLNESMADYFGWKYRPELIAQQAGLLQALAKKYPPSSYEALSRNLYAEPFGYTFANVILLDVLKGQPISCYKQIIDTAKRNGGDFNAAVQQVTGKDPKQVYAQVVKRFWK